MSMEFKEVSPGDWVKVNYFSVISRDILPMLVTHVDDLNPRVISGVAFSAKPESHGWLSPSFKIVNARFGTDSHYNWFLKTKKLKKARPQNGLGSVEQVMEAISGFDKSDPGLWTSTGDPSTKALSNKLGFQVSSKLRTEALERINA